MSPVLNAAQIQQFKDEGYLLLEDAIDATQIAIFSRNSLSGSPRARSMLKLMV